MDLEEIMNDDNESAKSLEHVTQVETTETTDAPCEKDETSDDSSDDTQNESTTESSSSEDRSYLCATPKCGLVFDTEKELKDHSRKHKVKRSHDGCFHCDVPGCKSHYGTKRALQRHIKNNHNTSVTRFQCTEKVGRRKACDKSYPTEQQLNQHIRGIHGDSFIAYCGKSFTWPLGHHSHQKKYSKCTRIIKG